MDQLPLNASHDLVTAHDPPRALDLGKLQSGDAAELLRLDQMTAATALTDEQRIASIAAGIPLATGPEVTAGQQLTNRDFNSAVAGLLDDGARPELVINYLATGKSDDPRGPEYARMWFEKLERDPEMQKRLLSGDPTLRRQLLAASMYKGAGPE